MLRRCAGMVSGLVKQREQIELFEVVTSHLSVQGGLPHRDGASPRVHVTTIHTFRDSPTRRARRIFDRSDNKSRESTFRVRPDCALNVRSHLK